MNPPVLILIHGAWHDSTCWSPVLPLLSAAGYRVLTPDLPGHGADPLPLAKVTLKAYVKRILELLETLEGKAVLTGHSMAGLVISEVAARRPDKVERLIYLCAYLPRHGESLFDLITLNRSHEPFTAIELALQVSDDKRSCSIAEEDIIPLFYQLASPGLAANAKASFAVQAMLPLAAKVNLSGAGFAAIPRTYICCTQDRVIPVHHQRRMLQRQTCDTLLLMDADHSPFLSRPEQLAALLGACCR
jgi:pimeloyl-ACP methyl ester carboxylesterase